MTKAVECTEQSRSSYSLRSVLVFGKRKTFEVLFISLIVILQLYPKSDLTLRAHRIEAASLHVDLGPTGSHLSSLICLGKGSRVANVESVISIKSW